MKHTVIVLLIAATTTAWAQTDLEANIKQSTAALFTEQVLGWQYSSAKSQRWTKGVDEKGAVGDSATAGDRSVRGVALGIEADHVVFLTLRSFVDPLYPNPAIQGMKTAIVDEKGSFVDPSIDDTDRAKFVRYSRIKLMWYEDLGGGKSKIQRLIEGVTEWDKAPPNCNGLGFFQLEQKEDYKGGTYKRPHEDISVAQHFCFQDMGTNKLSVRFFDSHDIALVYVPTKLFETQKRGLPPTLGLKSPTIAADLALRKSENLFGFKFNLIGQETLDSIRLYRPTKNSPEYPGFSKFLNLAGLALDPSTFKMLIAVDTALDQVLPETHELKSVQELWAFWKTIDKDRLLKIAVTVAMIKR